MNKEQWIEKEVEAKAKVMELDAQNRATLRSVLSKEWDFEERREAREEQGHSHSAVGDWWGAREVSE